MQLSAQLHGLGGVGKKQQDMDKDAIFQETFNECVKPPPNTRWSRASKDVTGLHSNHPNTTNADALEVVWEKITNCVNKHVGKDKRGLLVAWNGASCDVEWLHGMTEGRGAHLSFPPHLKHFLCPFCAL